MRESLRDRPYRLAFPVEYLLYLEPTASPSQVDSKNFIRDLLNFAIVVPTGTAQAQVALEMPMSDFEDALRVSAALHAGVNYIITRNTNHYRSSPIPSLTPGEFLALITG